MKNYCTQNNGICETCSLVSYNKDCKNNKLYTVEDLALRAGFDNNDILDCPEWVANLIIDHNRIPMLEQTISKLKSLMKDVVNGEYSKLSPETLLVLMGLDEQPEIEDNVIDIRVSYHSATTGELANLLLSHCGDYAGKFQDEAYKLLSCSGELMGNEWADIMFDRQRKVYAVWAEDALTCFNAKTKYMELRQSDCPKAFKEMEDQF